MVPLSMTLGDPEPQFQGHKMLARYTLCAGFMLLLLQKTSAMGK